MSKRSSDSNSNYGASKDIWASMRPYRVPYEEPKGSDARMMAAYKKAHAPDAPQASSQLAMVRGGNICRKCLLHIEVCRIYGENLKKSEQAAAILKLKNVKVEKGEKSVLEGQKGAEEGAKGEAKGEAEGGAEEGAEGGAEGGTESKENMTF
ncbi:uncharacterized protein LOC133848255 [Drosophila sulfurigaster albostrigata]|uniref:uncharacterized protein LOC133848255 n=1 Tax=Drosophila sulfurigaster albostrigata TaxID=89887 RepID=UPI002D219361|nr:uncharacterized protein LOC133848255 [Drosophila sulfurigaster albostrigata]